MKYIVENKNGSKSYWLASWEGDPGRTIIKANAKTFNSKSSAKKAIKKVVNECKFRKFTEKSFSIVEEVH